MATNDDIRIGLSVVADTAGTRKARQELEGVRKEIDTLKGAFNAGDKSAEEFGKELAVLEKREKALKGAINTVTGEFTKEAAAMKQAAAEARKLAVEQERVARADAKKALASTGSERLRTLGRDIRGLPSVQVPGLGIGTDTFGRAAEVAGRLGVTMGALGTSLAILTPIAIGVGFAIDKASKQIQFAKERIESGLKVVADVNAAIAQGEGTEFAQKQIEIFENQREAADLTAEYVKKRTEEIASEIREIEKGGVQGGVTDPDSEISRLTNLLAEQKALNDTTEKLKGTVADAATGIDLYNQALEDGTFAANDAIAAEQALAAERTQNVLQEASQAGELASLKERAATLTQEQIDSELAALERRRIGAEAELAALQASGDTSEEVAQKIAQLRESISFLGEQSDSLRTARRTARSSEADKAAEKARRDAERERVKAEKEIARESKASAKAQDNYADKIRDAKNAFSEAIEDINRGLQDDLIDNNRKLQDDLNEASNDFNQDQLKAERDYRRDLAQISRDAQRAERDATRSRDFAAAADARENANDAIEDRRRDEANENAERLIEFEQHNAELARRRDLANRDDVIAAERAARDAAIRRDRALREQGAMEANFQRNSLQGWNTYLGALHNRMQRFFEATGGSKGSAGSNSNVSFNQLQYMTG